MALKKCYQSIIQSKSSVVNNYYPLGGVNLHSENIRHDYDVFDNIKQPDYVRVADMREGKANDDGYRGIHVYYQKDHFHYPIEVQFVSARDHQFNEWLHIYVYKYIKDSSVGSDLRKLYDNGTIQDENQFRKELENVLSSRKEI